ncbi:cyclin-like protein [Anaeromyces robustus]|uniref:Cyclin-like protein n=1 Tax=Anaeromyces robustus TaxID=1754192 RepID=A0A1Y1WTV1_9FUNG|nr:cyclin-like protein [Anaeromyces robustus]|eukprot:ORX76738.1 cyclin-like protein [Anaeromyces robustus]
MEYRQNKPKFPLGNYINNYQPYYYRNRNYNNGNNNNGNNNYFYKRRNNNIHKPIIRKENTWLYTTEELNSSTPSIKDGYTPKDELKQRWKACAFIMSIGITMKIPQTTIATACIYLHRFYCRKSLKYYPAYEIAAASLYLASKLTDAQRRLKDIIIVCISKAQKNAKLNINEKTHEFDKWKKTILYHELEVLETICCDVNVDHPYSHLLNMMEKFNDSDHSNIVKLAWCFINDSFKTTMCLRYPAQIIAASALYMACKYEGEVLINKDVQVAWWNEFNINEHELLTATKEMADVYVRIIKKNNLGNISKIPLDKNPSVAASDAIKRKIQSTLLSPENINTSITSSPSPRNL